jgi:N6-L-threonylcarbamoyladenine synthase
MSFSGLKTAVINILSTEPRSAASRSIRRRWPHHFAEQSAKASFPRTMQAARKLGYQKIAVAGGVAANSRIRRDFTAAAEREGVKLFIPPLRLCGDNAAMIGSQGYFEYIAGVRGGTELNAFATKEL